MLARYEVETYMRDLAMHTDVRQLDEIVDAIRARGSDDEVEWIVAAERVARRRCETEGFASRLATARSSERRAAARRRDGIRAAVARGMSVSDAARVACVDVTVVQRWLVA